MSIVSINGLLKRYPRPDRKGETFNAVDGIDLDIAAGEVFGILGPNGAGKTTTLEMIEGLTDIDGGQISVCGHDVAREPYRVKQLIGVQLQANDYFEHLSLRELLSLFTALYGGSARPETLLSRVHLEDKANARPARLSGGQKQRFSIACALVHEPRVLFLDEPTTGLDPQAKRNLWDLIRELNRGGMTIVLTTHNMEEAEQLCDRLAIMDQGRILDVGSPKELIRRHIEPHVVEVHGPGLAGFAATAELLRSEQVGETLFCYTDNERALVASLCEHPDLSYLSRAADLEDVFLKLTGRDLRE